MNNAARGYSPVSVMIGGLVISLIALSAFLLSTKVRFQIEVIKEPDAPKNDVLQENIQATSTEATTATSTAATSVAVAVAASSSTAAPKPKVPAPPKITAEKKVVTAASGGWNSVYTDIADWEEAFFSDFNLVSFDVLLGQSNIDLQKRLVVSALETLKKLTQTVSGAKTRFPSQAACLNKEQETVDKFTAALNSALVYFDFASQLVKLDEFEAQLLAKLGAYSLRYENKEYGKAMQDIEVAKSLVQDMKTTALTAKTILPMPALDDYLKWADMYTLGLNEIYTNIQTGYYERVPTTDFVTIGELKTKATSDLTKQITEWSVANLNTVLTEAGQLLAESSRLCKKDE